jgi:pilus assembly protein CpaB
LFGGNSFNKSNINRPIIAAVVLGLLVAAIAATKLVHYTSTHVEMENVLVMAHDMGPYTVLQASDIAMEQAVKGSKQPGTINSPADAVGKMTTSPIYQGEQIETKRLVDAAAVTGKQIVAVNIDLARSDGGYLRPGDVVDAWWIPTDGNTQTPGIGWVQVATNAVVVDIKDSTGKSLFESGGSLVQQALISTGGSSAGSPAVAVLAVNAADVSKIIGGAIPKSENIALTKKFSQEIVQTLTQTAPPVPQSGTQNIHQAQQGGNPIVQQ